MDHMLNVVHASMEELSDMVSVATIAKVKTPKIFLCQEKLEIDANYIGAPETIHVAKANLQLDLSRVLLFRSSTASTFSCLGVFVDHK